jgi:phosphoglycolate phosphatase
MTGFTVAFDLDGTLVDSLNETAREFDRAFVLGGLPARGCDWLRPRLGRPAPEIFRANGADDVLAARLTISLRARLRDTVGTETTVFPEIHGVLKSLAAAGVTCVVATNRPTVLGRLMVRRTGLDVHVVRVFGCDAHPPKPDPAVLHEVLGWTYHDPQAAGPLTLMVGDTVDDVAAGRASGVTVVGVAREPGRAEALAESGADVVMANLGGLPEICLGGSA